MVTTKNCEVISDNRKGYVNLMSQVNANVKSKYNDGILIGLLDCESVQQENEFYVSLHFVDRGSCYDSW